MGNSHRRVCLVPRVPERSAQQETTQRFEKTETAADRIGPGYQRVQMSGEKKSHGGSLAV